MLRTLSASPRRMLDGETGPYTVSDYMKIPQDDIRLQLMRGWLVREPSPTEVHQRVVGNLHLILRRWADAQQSGKVYLAPFDTVLSAKSVLQPDLLFVSKGNESIITAANVQGAPDLVVEVLSGSTAKRDRIVKQSLYREAGIMEMWLVDAHVRLMEVVSLQQCERPVLRYQGAASVESPLLGKLDFAVEDLFRY